MLTVDDFDFDLPEHLIAQRPSPIRGHSRLMNAMHEIPKIQPFYEVANLFKGGELLVLNNTKVVPARLFAHKSNGGLVEIFFLKLLQSVKSTHIHIKLQSCTMKRQSCTSMTNERKFDFFGDLVISKILFS